MFCWNNSFVHIHLAWLIVGFLIREIDFLFSVSLKIFQIPDGVASSRRNGWSFDLVSRYHFVSWPWRLLSLMSCNLLECWLTLLVDVVVGDCERNVSIWSWLGVVSGLLSSAVAACEVVFLSWGLWAGLKSDSKFGSDFAWLRMT